MSLDYDPDEFEVLDPEDYPPLDSEEGRDKWAEILLQQDPADPHVDWADAVSINDGTNMVVRFRYRDGTEEVYDLQVRRQVVHQEPQPETPENERN